MKTKDLQIVRRSERVNTDKTVGSPRPHSIRSASMLALFVCTLILIPIFVGACAVGAGYGSGTVTLTSITPNTAPAGASGQAITVYGANFTGQSAITVNGGTRTTTFINGTQLSAALTSGDLSQATALRIGVTDPENGVSANSVVFSVSAGSLKVVTTSLPAAVMQALYAAGISVQGGVSPFSWRVASGQLPPGLTLAPASGSIAGAPTQSGQFNFTVQVSDSESTPQTASQALAMNVTGTASPLAITTSSIPGGISQTSYSAALAATGGASPYTWSVVSGTIPAGLTLNASSGLIAGSPTTPGTSSFSVQVKDSSSTPQTANANYSLVLVGPLSVATVSLPGGQAKSTYSVTLSSSGGQAPYVWSVTSGSLPAGLTLNGSTGVISGTPTASGTSSFTVQVSDAPSIPQTASRTLALTVAAQSQGTPLQVTSTSLASGQTKTAYSASLSATGGTAPYAWSIASGSLPTGLSLSGTSGVISGTPSAAGSSSFTVQVTDSSSTPQLATQPLSITVTNASAPPALAISTTALAGAQMQSGYSSTLTATGGTSPYSWSVSSGSLPGGLSLSAPSGVLSGTPTASGTYTFTVKVADSTSPTPQTATQSLTLAVDTSNPSGLSLSVPLITPSNQGQNYWSNNATTNGGAVVTISGGTAPYSCSVSSGSLPAGMTMAEVTPNYTPAGLCVISGTPTAAGNFTFSVTVTDAAANSATQSLTFPVVSANVPVISNISATNVTATSATLTWTTNVPADSQVSYGTDYFYLTTPEQDAGGVTSHSVQLTGLISGNSYMFAILSKGVNGGAPQSYLLGSDITGTFSTAAAPATGTFDFGVQGAGPNDVIQGYGMYVAVYNWYISGTSNWNMGSLKIQVQGIPPNSQILWPDEQSDGLGQCTISSLAVTNDSLSCYSPGPNTQFEILTNVGGTTPVGNYTLTVVGTTQLAGGATGPTHSFTWPMNVTAASFPSGTPAVQPAIPALSLWQSNMTTYGAGHWYNAQYTSGNPCAVFDDQCVDYYDGQWVYYQIGLYTGNPTYWNVGANNSRTLYRDGYVIPHAGTIQGYWVFPHGLHYDCVTNGNATSCSALNQIANNANGAGMSANGIPYADALNIREAAYMLGAKRLNYDAGGNTTLAQVQTMASYVLGIVDQVTNSTAKWEQPFMDGLAGQALIEYYEDPKTGNGDVRVPPAIKALADYLWTNDWIPWNGTNGMFLYNSAQWKVGLPGEGTMLESLNLLIAPMYAWLYANTGQVQYQLEGDTIWAAGVNDPPSDGIGWSGKNFSQQYRWSFDYVLWRGGK